jgi:hypothetical protein
MEMWFWRCGFWWFFSTATTLVVVFSPATVLVVVHCYGDGCFGGGSFFALVTVLVVLFCSSSDFSATWALVGDGCRLLAIRCCFVASQKCSLAIKILSSVTIFFLSLLLPPHNQIANVASLPIPVISGGLYRVGCLGGLQFAHICPECVWLSALSFV